jgi:23S rRNA pseudouridine2605 synthase
MGKKHNSGNAAGGRGRTDRPSSSAGGSGFYQKFSAPRGAGSGSAGEGRPPRFGGDRDRSTGRSGDAPRGDFSSRPSFGRGPADRTGGSGFGGPKKFGNGGGSFGGRNEGGFGGNSRPRDTNGGDSRSFGSRPSGGRDFDRGGSRREDSRSGGFGAARGNNDDRRSGGFGGPRRDNDDRRSGGFGGGGRRDDDRRGGFNSAPRRDNDDRPVRPFEPRKTWDGQPYRQEGRPAVPRGAAGERNRKFVKADPNQPAAPTGYTPRPARFEPTPRPEDSNDQGPDRAIRPARPFDFRSRPEGLDAERPTSPRPERGADFGDRPRGAFNDRRESGFKPRSTGERPAFGNRSFNDRSEGGFGNRNSTDRREPSRGASDADRDARPYGTRPERPAPKRFGHDASTPNRADKLKRGEVAGQAPDYKNLKHYEDDKSRGNKRRREEEQDVKGDELRLNRYIANAGVCSRREADSLIAAGEIKVNGEVVTEMGYKVQPTDTVQYGKTNLNREKLVYVLLNKPKDTITTTEDPEGRRTVMDLVKESSKERIFPVGRLDRNTTGLLLFTNDGEVAQKLSHPSHRNKKIYQAELDKPLTEEHLGMIAAGIELEDGKAEVDDVAVVAGNPHFVGIEIHIGRNRIVRRIFEHLGYDVVSLDRVQYAGLTKKDLPRGKWRFLNEKEVIRLKYFM